MAFVEIDATKPSGAEMASLADDYIRETRLKLNTNLAEISGYPDIPALKTYTWTTSSRPTGSQLKSFIMGYNSTTGLDEHWDGTTWVPHGTQTATIQALIDAVVPIGIITEWSGSIASIPPKWRLCDGSGGTPDLRDRFIVGAGNSYGVGTTGGEATHTLSIGEIPSHTHSGVAGTGWFGGFSTGGGGGAVTGNGTIGYSGGGGAHENRPPFYALAYIMRVS